MPPAGQLAPHSASAAGHADTWALLVQQSCNALPEYVQSEQSTVSAFVTPPARILIAWHNLAPFPLHETDRDPTGESANTSMCKQCCAVSVGELHATVQLVAPPPVGQRIWAL